MLFVALAGPAMNVALGAFFWLLLKFDPFKMADSDFANRVYSLALDANVVLAIFNMFPIAPLDGSKVLSALLPIEAARVYDNFMARHGTYLFLGFLLVARPIIAPVINGVEAYLYSAM